LYSGRRSAAELLTRNAVRRIPANIVKLPELLALNSDHATSSGNSVSVSAGKDTTDEKQAQHFGQSQT
jgi:hypothetical protein